MVMRVGRSLRRYLKNQLRKIRRSRAAGMSGNSGDHLRFKLMDVDSWRVELRIATSRPYLANEIRRSSQ